jgi:hypothetical protein
MKTRRPEDPQLKELVELGILERVSIHPWDGLRNRYRMIDPEGVRKALEELGYIERRKPN